MKWLYSTLAFFLAAIFISSLTTHIFVTSVSSGFEGAKTIVSQKSQMYADQSVTDFYSNLDVNQKSQIDQIKSLTVEQRQQALGDQCLKSDLKDAPFCNPDFISGKITFDDSLKVSSKKSFEDAQIQALQQVDDKLTSYEKYNLLWVAVVSGVLALVFYALADGILFGLQVYFGNIAWLSFMSALSFRFMPYILDKTISTILKSDNASQEKVISLSKEIIFGWLNPAMNHAFVVSTWLTVIFTLIWICFKVFRNYNVGVEQ